MSSMENLFFSYLLSRLINSYSFLTENVSRFHKTVRVLKQWMVRK
jgi:hypothetical protein